MGSIPHQPYPSEIEDPGGSAWHLDFALLIDNSSSPALLMSRITRMYYVIGADQREYGPVSAEDVRAWIAQGRLTAQSLARPDQTVGWRPLTDFPEFAQALAQAAPAPYPRSTTVQPPVENNMALASLILACVSLVCCQPLAIVGLILGLIALSQTKDHPEKGGRGLAIAGVAVSIAAIVLFGVLAAFGAFREVIERLFK